MKYVVSSGYSSGYNRAGPSARRTRQSPRAAQFRGRHICELSEQLKYTQRSIAYLYIENTIVVCLCVCPELIGKTTSARKLEICIQG